MTVGPRSSQHRAWQLAAPGCDVRNHVQIFGVDGAFSAVRGIPAADPESRHGIGGSV
jgi:hypothetical protein